MYMLRNIIFVAKYVMIDELEPQLQLLYEITNYTTARCS